MVELTVFGGRVGQKLFKTSAVFVIWFTIVGFL